MTLPATWVCYSQKVSQEIRSMNWYMMNNLSLASFTVIHSIGQRQNAKWQDSILRMGRDFPLPRYKKNEIQSRTSALCARNLYGPREYSMGLENTARKNRTRNRNSPQVNEISLCEPPYVPVRWEWKMNMEFDYAKSHTFRCVESEKCT